MGKKPYALAICILMYVILCTKPDIYYGVGFISRYQLDPRSGTLDCSKAYTKVFKKNEGLDVGVFW